VVDDEVLIRKSLSKVLRARGYAVELASTGAEGLQKVTEIRPQVMILDMRLPDTDGISVLRRVRQVDTLLQVIVITAFGDVQSAVDAMKLGACDFLRKPYEMEDIVLAVQAAGQTFRQATELDLYRRQAWRQFSDDEIIGRSGPMKQVRDLIEKVVRSKATSVLITGESGTGKELVARAIHYRGDRAKAPLMEVNCSSFHENLLENELFGHERRFTDATTDTRGAWSSCATAAPFPHGSPRHFRRQAAAPIDLQLHGRAAQVISVDIRIVSSNKVRPRCRRAPILPRLVRASTCAGAATSLLLPHFARSSKRFGDTPRPPPGLASRPATRELPA
jgi:ActR/RegA family two-component response regulator